MGHDVSYVSRSGARASSLGVEAFIKGRQELFSGCWHYTAKRAQPCLTRHSGPSEGRNPAQQEAATSRSTAGGSLQPTSLRGAGPVPGAPRDTAGPWPCVCSLSTCMQWTQPYPRHTTAAAPWVGHEARLGGRGPGQELCPWFGSTGTLHIAGSHVLLPRAATNWFPHLSHIYLGIHKKK